MDYPLGKSSQGEVPMDYLLGKSSQGEVWMDNSEKHSQGDVLGPLGPPKVPEFPPKALGPPKVPESLGDLWKGLGARAQKVLQKYSPLQKYSKSTPKVVPRTSSPEKVPTK